MLDSDGKKIFASLDSDEGIGGDIVSDFSDNIYKPVRYSNSEIIFGLGGLFEIENTKNTHNIVLDISGVFCQRIIKV